MGEKALPGHQEIPPRRAREGRVKPLTPIREELGGLE
jgi:hypothetical protein